MEFRRLRHFCQGFGEVYERLAAVGCVEEEDVEVWTVFVGGRCGGRAVVGDVGGAEGEGGFGGVGGAVIGG